MSDGIFPSKFRTLPKYRQTQILKVVHLYSLQVIDNMIE